MSELQGQLGERQSSKNCLFAGQRAVSSVGRAPARQAGGHWFEPSTAHSLVCQSYNEHS
jgi:hypothetical protein